MNIPRRNEPVATDTIHALIAAIGGYMHAQIFIGRKSLVIDIFGLYKEKDFVNSLLDVITKRGAMDLLISDGAQAENSKRVQEVLRQLIIPHHRSEPYYQWQNFAERRWRDLKANHKWLMSYRNAPSRYWLDALIWCANVMNLTAEKSLDWRTPLEVLTGITQDISQILIFMFNDKVHAARYESSNYSNIPGDRETSRDYRVHHRLSSERTTLSLVRQ